MTQAWARAFAAGVPDDVFWASTMVEVVALVRELEDRVRATVKREQRNVASLMAAIYNASGRVKRRVRASDFLDSPPVDLGPDGVREALLNWARSHNAGIKA